jgi:Cation efflux family
MGASMVESSRRVVLAALAGNGAIALAKFAAAGISGSTAMLTEAIHSLVDTADQVLLLVGQTRGERPADATHPLGHGMEVYFWSFIVALMVFLVGGVLSMYEGVRQILNPAPVISPGISLTVLAVAARLAKDGSLSAEQRKNFEYTIKVDAEFRQLRKQAAKLTRVASLIAAPVAAAAVPTKPAITVFDSNHGETLPGVQIPNPVTSSDETARRDSHPWGFICHSRRVGDGTVSGTAAGKSLHHIFGIRCCFCCLFGPLH